MNENILLVLPTFNNEETLKSVIQESQKYIKSILIINDGSTDRTIDILNQINNIHIISHPVNLGKGQALRTAFNFAIKHNFSHVITMDTDGQHLPESLQYFIYEISNQSNTIIIGDRIFKNNYNIPFSSKFGRTFSNFWIYIETGKLLKDTQSGFRAYPIDFIKMLDLKSNRYDFEIEILVKHLWEHGNVSGINIPVIYQPKGIRVSHFKPFLDNFYLTKLHTTLVLQRLLSFFRSKKNERKGASLIPFFIRIIGISNCYKISYFVVFFYFISNRNSLAAILYFYRRLNVNNIFIALRNGYRNYLYFTASMLDRVALALNKNNFNLIKKIDYHIEESEPLILIGSHFGDWTISSVVFKSKTNRKVAIVMNENSTKIFHKIIKERKIFNNVVIVNADQDQFSILFEIKELIKENAIICFLCDRVTDNIEKSDVLFLNESFQLATGPFSLARIFNCKVIAFFSLKTRFHYKGDYHLFCYTLKEKGQNISVNSLIQDYVNILENLVKKYPENWFNFRNLWKIK